MRFNPISGEFDLTINTNTLTNTLSPGSSNYLAYYSTGTYYDLRASTVSFASMTVRNNLIVGGTVVATGTISGRDGLVADESNVFNSTDTLGLTASNTNYLTVLGSTQTKIGGLNVMGNVGIGTTNTNNSNLQVIGNVRVGGVASGSVGDIDIGFGGLRIGETNAIAQISSGFSGKFWRFLRNSDLESNSQFDYDGTGPNYLGVLGGNTGIGVAAPVNKLDVEGAMAIGATYSGTSAAPANGLIVEGTVGIGTASPGHKLHVAGTNESPTLTIEDFSTGSSRLFHRRNGVEWQWELNSSGIGLYESASSAWRFFIETGGGVGVGVLDPVGLFQVGGGSLTVLSNGNVGIGTTAPASKLDVRGEESIFKSTGSHASAKISHIFPTVNQVETKYNSSNMLASIRAHDDANGFDLGTRDGSNMVLKVNNIVRLALFQSDSVTAINYNGGNVGIGLTTPVNKLDVEGNMAIGATYSGTSAAPTNGLIVEGSVGIGTTAPGAGAILDVAATTTDYGLQLKYLGTAAANRGAAILFETNDLTSGGPREDVGYAKIKVAKENGTNADDAVYMSFATAGNDESGGASEKLRITSRGDVGIGTGIARAKLHVYGSTGAAGGPLVLVSTGTTKLFEVNPSSVVTNVNSWFTEHIVSTGTTPAVGSGVGDCGTSPGIRGTDTKGVVTVGSVANGGVCTITFAKPYNVVPMCMAQNSTTANLVRAASVSETSIALTGTLLAGDLLQYICIE